MSQQTANAPDGSGRWNGCSVAKAGACSMQSNPGVSRLCHQPGQCASENLEDDRLGPNSDILAILSKHLKALVSLLLVTGSGESPARATSRNGAHGAIRIPTLPSIPLEIQRAEL